MGTRMRPDPPAAGAQGPRGPTADGLLPGPAFHLLRPSRACPSSQAGHDAGDGTVSGAVSRSAGAAAHSDHRQGATPVLQAGV